MDVPVTPERWRRINEVLDAVLEQEAAGRAGALARACGGDEALRGEVESLLGSLEQAGGFLEAPPVESVAELFCEGQTLVGRSVGPYRGVSEIARGGMGTVYRSEEHTSELQSRQ